jgi:hypothetical protein
MKRIVFALFAVVLLCSISVSAEEYQKDETKWASVSYVIVPVYKILEAKDGYLVVYEKNKAGAGSTVIPKKWANGNIENPRKLSFRSLSGTLQPFMTIITKDGIFLRVILSAPLSKNNAVWGIADYHQNLEGSDKDTLEKLAL